MGGRGGISAGPGGVGPGPGPGHPAPPGGAPRSCSRQHRRPRAGPGASPAALRGEAAAQRPPAVLGARPRSARRPHAAARPRSRRTKAGSSPEHPRRGAARRRRASRRRRLVGLRPRRDAAAAPSPRRAGERAAMIARACTRGLRRTCAARLPSRRDRRDAVCPGARQLAVCAGAGAHYRSAGWERQPGAGRSVAAGSAKGRAGAGPPALARDAVRRARCASRGESLHPGVSLEQAASRRRP